MNMLKTELPEMLHAQHIRDYLGISQALTYSLMNSEGFPTVRINTRMLVPKESFMKWLEQSEGKTIRLIAKEA